MALWLNLLLFIWSIPLVKSFSLDTDVGGSCSSSYRRALRRAEPILPKMGKRGVEAVDWYLEHWNHHALGDDDQLHRDTIAGALKAIFAWEIDPGLGTGTKYYKHVAENLPGTHDFQTLSPFKKIQETDR